MAHAIPARAPGAELSRNRSQKADPNPNLAALLAELDRPLNQSPRLQGLGLASAQDAREGLLDRLRRKRRDSALLDKARLAAERALGASAGRLARAEAEALMDRAARYDLPPRQPG